MFIDSWFAKRGIIAVLNDSSTQKLKSFNFGGIGFSPKVFPVLAQAIDDGGIKVEYDDKKKGKGMAEYDYKTNTFYVGFTEAAELSKKALVLHEATHAVYDVVKQKMNVATSESIAYIVQCMYARQNNNTTNRLNSSDSAKDEVFAIGWEIAGSILDGKSISLSEQSAMLSAVSKHPFYSANFAGSAGFNG